MPHRFDEPEATPTGEYPAHMAVALQFGKFVNSQHSRVFSHSRPSTHITIDDIIYRIDSSDTKLVDAMKRWRAYDKIHPLKVRFLVNASTTLGYCLDHPEHRWYEGEQVILKSKNAVLMYRYARDIMHDVWPEAESYIMRDMDVVGDYITNRRHSQPWPEAEPYIIQDPIVSGWYARKILGRRWLEAEPTIHRNSNAWDIYTRYFPDAEESDI